MSDPTCSCVSRRASQVTELGGFSRVGLGADVVGRVVLLR